MNETLDVGYGFIPCAYDDPERTHFLSNIGEWVTSKGNGCEALPYRKPVKIPEGKELVPAGEIESSDMEYWGRENVPGWKRNHNTLNRKCGDYPFVAAFIRDKKPAPAKPALQWDQPLQTRDGRKARLLGKLNGRPDSGYFVAVADENGVETLLIGEEVINVPQRIKREVWVVEWEGGMWDAFGSEFSACEAIKHRSRGRKALACIKVAIDCAVGEGL